MTKYFISDTHWGHENCWAKFKLADGVTPMRPFTSTEEMDETMIQNWNKIVKPGDTVIHCGDVVISRKHLATMHRLNGHKRLVRGNHDIFAMQDYIDAGFEEIYGVYVLPKIRVICSHIPIHPDSLYRWNQNWHGHLHANRVPHPNYPGKFDERYKSVCVEHINYTPVSLEQLIAEME